METITQFSTAPGLRVLLVGSPGDASLALTGWLWEQGGLVVVGPAASTPAALELAVDFRPDVVLLDFHGWAGFVGPVISLFKELAPAPQVFVLTYETSNATRRHCQAAQADAVFHKTAELDPLKTALDALRSPSAAGISGQRPSALR
jgi:DNA-binding NarL/FixJ family response regulator